MQILAVDIGTGTQDILLFDTDREPENALKLVMPSPTVILERAIREFTRSGEDLLLTGVTMGGGPCSWAVADHLKEGLRVFATPDAARTFNDDLSEVIAMGVDVVGDDEVGGIAGLRTLTMQDFDYPKLRSAFAAFGVDLDQIDVVALAVFDHGAAPSGVSDRRFRFQYLEERILTGGGLASFAFPREQIPPSMTRLCAAASTVPDTRPLLAMDTAPAAILGALEDRVVAAQEQLVVANLGNFHTLAFHLRGGGRRQISGLFEHHTGRLSRVRLEELLKDLAAGTISNDELFADHGHGALRVDSEAASLDFLAVTGPRRAILEQSQLQPYLAVPYGDMMMAGCWGLVRACAHVIPWTADPIEHTLG
jgi:uncharacterized protein (DUF1786 family)